MKRIRKWSRQKQNKGLVILLIIPVLITAWDLFIRVFLLKMGAADTGADLALLGLSTIVAFNIEDKQEDVAFKYAVLLSFGLLWLCCIYFVALSEQYLHTQRLYAALAIIVGFATLFSAISLLLTKQKNL